ncbi:MAG: glycosyltransferase family 2 protein [Chitinophagales bacterium]|nr:glycosyltransferase family 2 protein [Chitinophagales bacterium]
MILTIICPTYNEEKFIEQTIQSFLNQQYHSFELEILICDGMSTDKTREIVTAFSKQDNRIRLIDNPKRKTPFAFNIGLKEAKGEYIAILGAHTKYDSNYLQACYDDLIKTNSIGCSGRVITEAANNSLEAKLCESMMHSSFGVSSNSFRVMKEGYVHSVNFPVFKKQVLIDLGGYNELLIRNQDNDMNQRLLDAGYQLYCTWKTKCYYRPPSTFKKLMKYAYTNGSWNAISFFINKKSMRLHHFIPFLFVTTLIVFLIVGIAEYFINHTIYFLFALATIIALHLLIGIIASLATKGGNPLVKAILLPFIFLGFHFNYGWGTLKTFITKSYK